MGMQDSSEPVIQSYSVSQMYNLYRERKLIVNRRYQRKLCWTIEEKRNFIDTIMKGLPVPMIMFAKNNDSKYEIIDGMQRLEAIFALIEQKYSLKDGYFDLLSMPDTINAQRDGTLKQKKGVLGREVCRKIANYPLPLSIFSYDRSSQIEEAFKRINSTGRHLSLQELRQIGIRTQYAELVRTLSFEMRGDISADILYLNEMSNISLSNHRLPYGIYTGSIFWIENEIINTSLLRLARDEEIIAYLLANIVLLDNEQDTYTANVLNKYYGYDSNPLNTDEPIEMTKIENAVERMGKETIKKNFNMVVSVIRSVLDKNSKKFKDMIFSKSVRGIRFVKDFGYVFQCVFMAIYNAMYIEGRQKINYDLLSKNLMGIGNDVFDLNNLDELRRSEVMRKKTAFIKTQILSSFSKSNIEDPAVDDWVSKCTNIIMKSRTEQNLYDFKIGFVEFGKQRINTQIIDKVLKSLTAINNIGPHRVGYILVGIADSGEDAEKYSQIYQSKYKVIDEKYIVGIEKEADAIKLSLDRYTHSIKEYIKNQHHISGEYTYHIIQNMTTPNYYGHQLILFKTNFPDPVMYDGKLYERMFTDVNEIPADQYNNLYKRFYSTSLT